MSSYCHRMAYVGLTQIKLWCTVLMVMKEHVTQCTAGAHLCVFNPF